MSRTMLPARRPNVTMTMRFALNAGSRDALTGSGQEIELAATFGFDDNARVREVFCLPLKSGTDLQAMLHDTMMCISVGLQHGVDMAELARVLGEDDAKPPRSVIGAIIRTGAFLDAEFRTAKPEGAPG